VPFTRIENDPNDDAAGAADPVQLVRSRAKKRLAFGSKESMCMGVPER